MQTVAADAIIVCDVIPYFFLGESVVLLEIPE
jgi:hypothetical protein